MMVSSSCSFVGETGKKGDVASVKLKIFAVKMNMLDKSELRADLNKQIDSGVVCFQATNSQRIVRSRPMASLCSHKCLVRL